MEYARQSAVVAWAVLAQAALLAPGGTTRPSLAIDAVAKQIARGEKLLYTKDYKEGVRLLKDAAARLTQRFEADLRDHAAAYQLARALFALERNREALKSADRAMLLAPRNTTYHLLRGRILAALDRLREAEAEMEFCVKLQPGNAEYHLALGRARAARLKYADALKSFRKAIALAPKRSEPVFKAGVVLVSMGREAEAAEMFHRAAVLDPTQSIPHYNLGQIHQNQGKYRRALESFQRAVELEPTLWQARAKLVQLYEALGRPDRRDAERDALFKLRTSGKVASLSRAEFYCRDQFTVGGRRVMTFEYFDLSGPRAVRYVFYVLQPGTQKPDYRVSLGSYEITNMIAREQGALKEGQRLFHLDLYRPQGHALYRMFRGEPKYEEVKTLVGQIVRGKLQALSASTTSRPSAPASRPASSRPSGP